MTDGPDTPLVSVIIPTFNSRRTLMPAIESVLLQDYPDFELWVIGDGCTDDSEDCVRELHDTRIHWIGLTDNSGTPSVPRNAGLQSATGDYISYLGHDDLWLPWHLSTLVGEARQSGADIIATLGGVFGPKGAMGAFGLRDDPSQLEKIISPSNWMLSGAASKRIGAWSTALESSLDRDYLDRAFALGLQTRLQRRLTTLKFPSSAWRIYSGPPDLPQRRTLERIRKNPHEVELALLTQMASLLAEYPAATLCAPKGVSGAARGLARALLDAYGRRRWPLPWITRALSLHRRGLPLWRKK